MPASARRAARLAAPPVAEQPLEMARPRTLGRSLLSVEPVSLLLEPVSVLTVPVSVPVSVVPASGSVGASLQTKLALQTPAEPASGLRQSCWAPSAKQVELPGQPASQVWVQNWPMPTKFLQRPPPQSASVRQLSQMPQEPPREPSAQSEFEDSVIRAEQRARAAKRAGTAAELLAWVISAAILGGLSLAAWKIVAAWLA